MVDYNYCTDSVYLNGELAICTTLDDGQYGGLALA